MFGMELDRIELVPAGERKFEVSVNGDLVHSKLETGEFPKHDEILSAVRQRLGSAE